MSRFIKTVVSLFLALSAVPCINLCHAQQPFKVLAFFTAKHDRAHITFVHEANKWFAGQAALHQFTYDSTDNWDDLNETFLKQYQVVMFLDTRPETPSQRQAFQQYMENGRRMDRFSFCRIRAE